MQHQCTSVLLEDWHENHTALTYTVTYKKRKTIIFYICDIDSKVI